MLSSSCAQKEPFGAYWARAIFPSVARDVLDIVLRWLNISSSLALANTVPVQDYRAMESMSLYIKLFRRFINHLITELSKQCT